jgi:hypothetical protein
MAQTQSDPRAVAATTWVGRRMGSNITAQQAPRQDAA